MSSVCERESGDTPGPAYTSTWCADGVGPGIVFERRKRKLIPKESTTTCRNGHCRRKSEHADQADQAVIN